MLMAPHFVHCQIPICGPAATRKPLIHFRHFSHPFKRIVQNRLGFKKNGTIGLLNHCYYYSSSDQHRIAMEKDEEIPGDTYSENGPSLPALLSNLMINPLIYICIVKL